MWTLTVLAVMLLSSSITSAFSGEAVEAHPEVSVPDHTVVEVPSSSISSTDVTNGNSSISTIEIWVTGNDSAYTSCSHCGSPLE